MKVQAEYEPLLFPSAHRLPDYQFYRIPHEYEAPGRAYARLYAAADRRGREEGWRPIGTDPRGPRRWMDRGGSAEKRWWRSSSRYWQGSPWME